MGKRSRTKRERKAQPAAKLSAFFDEARADFRSDFPPRNTVTVTAKYPGNIAPAFVEYARRLGEMDSQLRARLIANIPQRLTSMAIEFAPPQEPDDRRDAFVPRQAQRVLSAAMFAEVQRRLRTNILTSTVPTAERWDSYVNPAAAWMLKSGMEIPVPTPLTHPRRFAFLRMTDIIAASPSPAIWYSIALVMREELKASEDPERWLPLKPFPGAKPAITSPNTLRAFVRRRVEALPEEAMVHLDRLLEGGV
jgi:hypothetical protein